MSTIRSLVSGLLLSSLVAAAPKPLVKKSVPYGQVITGCTQPGVVAVSFDDGPYIYTEHVLDLLKAGNQHVTFFQNGNNYDSIYNHNSTLLRIIAEGHQIGAHT